MAEVRVGTGYSHAIAWPETADTNAIAAADATGWSLRRVVALHRRMLLRSDAEAFLEPVDAELAGYHRLIRSPMDLGTILERLQTGGLDSLAEYARLVRLTFCNARVFNRPNSTLYRRSLALELWFNKELLILAERLAASQLE